MISLQYFPTIHVHCCPPSTADYVAWKGRYCPFDFAMFENFMLYVLAQVMGNIPAGSDPWDINIDTDALGKQWVNGS